MAAIHKLSVSLIQGLPSFQIASRLSGERLHCPTTDTTSFLPSSLTECNAVSRRRRNFSAVHQSIRKHLVKQKAHRASSDGWQSHEPSKSFQVLSSPPHIPKTLRVRERKLSIAAATSPSVPAYERQERDGGQSASSSGRSSAGKDELEYKWLIEGGEKGPVQAADDDEELVEWEEYEEEVEIEEGEEYDKVVYVEETEEETVPYPFSKAGTVSMKQFKQWPEQWPEIRELQEKVKKMFTVDEAKHVMKLSNPMVRRRYPITTNYQFDFRLAIMELFIALVREENGFAICFLVPDGKKEPANNTEVGLSIAVRNVLEHPKTGQPYLEVMYQDHTFTKYLIDTGTLSTEQIADHYQRMMQECTPASQPQPKQILCSERMFARLRRLLQENEVLLGELTNWQEARRTEDWHPSFIQCFENVDFDKHEALVATIREQGLKPVKVGRDWYVTPLQPGDEGYDPKKAAAIAEEGPPGESYKEWLGVDLDKVGVEESRSGKGPPIETYSMPKDLNEIAKSMKDMEMETEESLRRAQAFAQKYGLPLNEAIEALAQLEEMEDMAGGQRK